MRFELLAPHVLVVDGLSRLVEVGTIIDADTVPGFVPTPNCRPLDRDAWEAVRRVCDTIRRGPPWPVGRPDVNIPGFGHSSG